MIDRSTTLHPRIDEGAYRGQWLALHPETVAIVAHADTLRAAKAASTDKGVPQPLLHSVPESDGYFVGAAWHH